MHPPRKGASPTSAELRRLKERRPGCNPDLIDSPQDSRFLAGRLQLDADTGTVADWLVKMRRLPRDAMLDAAIEEDDVDEGALRRAGERLSEFYRTSEPVDLSASEYLDRLERAIRDDAEELLQPSFDLASSRIHDLRDALLNRLSRESSWFETRSREGRIVDGHGDLRPEHICLEPKPIILDRLDFNREFRMLDPAEELSFLAVESEVAGSDRIGPLMFETYHSVTGDAIPPFAIAFFKSKRCLLRAKLSLAHTLESQYQEDSKWTDKGLEYLRFGEHHAERGGLTR